MKDAVADRGKDIPEKVRAQVIERDANCCRCCGQWVEHPHLHHIVYRSHLGRHVPDNLISLCYECHFKRAHGAQSRAWRDIFVELVKNPSITGFALRRWQLQNTQN